MSVGRNDPCPCGSGKKYKKCCLPRETAPVGRTRAEEPLENHFIAESRPDLDKAADRLLRRLESGEGKGLEAEFRALYQDAPNHHITNYALGVYVAMGEKDAVGGVPFL